MLLPLGDHPNPPGTAWVNNALIALNVLVFLVLLPQHYQPADPQSPVFREYLELIARENGVQVARAAAQQLSAYDLTVFEYGFRPGAPTLLTLFTSLFLHGGWLHLGGNMLFLWIFGNNVEYRVGSPAYLLLYLGAGVVASGGDALLRAGSLMPSLGASGAISGVLGCYFVWFPRNVVRVYVFLFPIFFDIVLLPARFVLGFFLLVDNLLPVLLSGAAGGVAHGAHIGGFLGGAALAAVLGPGKQEPPEPGNLDELRRDG